MNQDTRNAHLASLPAAGASAFLPGGVAPGATLIIGAGGVGGGGGGGVTVTAGPTDTNVEMHLPLKGGGAVGLAHGAAAAPPAATVPPAPAPAAGAPAQPAAEPDPAAAERARVAGILTAPEAAGRDALARHLAFNTGMDATAACAILAAAPQDQPAAQSASQAPAPRQSLDQRMQDVPTPPVGVTGAAPGVSDPDAKAAEFILAAARRARGENS